MKPEDTCNVWSRVMNSSKLFLALVIGCLAPGFASSQSLLDRFDQIDRNGDGKVSPEELPRAEVFKRLDRNGDGAIERKEISAMRTQASRNAHGLGILDAPEHNAHLNLPYHKVQGVRPNLLSLDLYVPKGDAKGRPVMIMIHGGGWRGGDKANPAIVGSKMRHFVSQGYVYASINYRLSPQTPQEGGLKHPVHAEDCAKAVAWIHENISKYGGDPDQLHLMGHSAGGHLAAILGTNARFLKEAGKDISILKSNVLLDPAAIDIPRYFELTEGRGMNQLYALAFGTDKANQLDASPQQHIKEGQYYPPTLVFYGGERMFLNQLGPSLAEALTQAGAPSQAVDTITLDHGQINTYIGMIGDKMTPLIMKLHAGEDASSFPDQISYKSTE